MKVNTDGVLLGAAMTVKPEDRNFLDIGTGTGTIALMAAQRVNGDGSHVADAPRNDVTDHIVQESTVQGVTLES